MKHEKIRSLIKSFPDFPKPGILFRDIMPVLAAPDAFLALTEDLAVQVNSSGATCIMGLESRGFIIGVAVAKHLKLPFIPARKSGKLPGHVLGVSYALEYGEQTLEIQHEALQTGDSVAIVDDLLATGGTANAAGQLVTKAGAAVSGYFFAIELEALQGRSVMGTSVVYATLQY